ncbi:methylated-DNA--[protein]-cysteine S-methyltransferase [Glutamicibacter sp. NPDC087344]|uniref:methylated-DNA--[protein]-cysteine S-methyltransferase n=1 Tax=Glutamicibacter sp. NPDC087344 TaxID=3363994 RepID=UPI00380B75FF
MSEKNAATLATQDEGSVLQELNKKFVQDAHDQGLVEISYRIVESPIGRLLIATTEAGLVRVAFETEGHESILDTLAQKIGPRILKDRGALDDVARQLDQYFDGSLRNFSLSLDLRLSTEFRRQVQVELGNIAYGQTLSYAQMAQQVGKPKAVRAVGTACATNPLPIVLPCHRVLRSDGSLGGYLGGLDVKSRLLHLENPDYLGTGATLF